MHRNGYEHLWTYAWRSKGSVWRTQPLNQEQAKNTRTYHLHMMRKYLLYSNWRTSIHRDTTLSLSLSYSLIYQGEASPLKGSSHPWVRCCVSQWARPPPHLFIGLREVVGAPKASTSATYSVATRGAEEWGPSCCILREKELEAASFLCKLQNLAV
jgi:hypothetical protein